MKIFDTFLFGGELDMLECRLYELQDTPIYRHVIVEAPVTFQGRPKPLVFREHEGRFAPWKDRIRYVVADPAGPGPWEREHQSRETTWEGLDGAEPGDVIIHADVDEIPLAACIPGLAGVTGPVKWRSRCAVFAVDWELPWPWSAPSAARRDQIPGFTWLRERCGAAAVLDGAWHLSWLGGPDAMRAKVNAFSHTEVIDWVTEGIGEGRYYERGLFWGTPHGARGETQLLARDVDESWPRWVHERRCPPGWFRPR